MAVFDTGPGIVGLYEYYKDLLNYYIDDRYEYYGLYDRKEINKRIEYLKQFFKKDKKIYVLEFDAINYFKNIKGAEFGKTSLEKNLKDKKILCLSSPLTKREKTLDEFTNGEVQYIEVPLLINASNDQVSDYILKLICDEYFKNFDTDKYSIIFLASSGLHMRKDFFRDYFDKDVFTNVDAVIEDYEYAKENIIRDYFYVTDSKRRFYSRAEGYLREKKILKDRQLLNVSKMSFKK